METNLEYITHHLSLKQIGAFTKVTILVKDTITYDWFDIIMDSDYSMRFVEGERILIRNFLKSLTELPTINSTYSSLSLEYTTFQNEANYYIFCVKNDLPFNEQEWFKTAYIQSNIFVATTIIINKSIQLIARLYPETIHFPDNSIDKIFENLKSDSVFRDDYYEIEKILKDNGIDRFYHSTATANINSIKTCKGLLSIERLKRNNSNVIYASSETSRYIDASKGLSDYVHLSFESYYPMLKKAVLDGRLSDYTILIISPVVALLKDTMFTEMNLVTTGTKPSKDINVLRRIPFCNFHNKHYWTLSERDKKSYMSEVLVKGYVPSLSILNWDSL